MLVLDAVLGLGQVQAVVDALLEERVPLGGVVLQVGARQVVDQAHRARKLTLTLETSVTIKKIK